MGTTTSTVYVTNANVTTPVIVSNVPSDILGLAVTNLNIEGVSPAPANDDTAAAQNDQIIQDHIGQRTKDLFKEEFEYDPYKTLPEDINTPSTGVKELLDKRGSSYWFFADDPASDAQIRKYVLDALGHFNRKTLHNQVMEFTALESNEIVEAIIKDINKVFYLNYSVWTSDTDNYHGPLKKVAGKKLRAQIDIAYNAYRGKNGQGKDGVYIYILSAVYLAEFNPF